MNPYHKINTIWKRDKKTGEVLDGQFSCDEFEYLANCRWEWTEKVDGTNIRVIRSEGRWEFRGKSDNASIPAPLVEFLRGHFERWIPPAIGDDNLTLYGEGYGWKIQKVGPSYKKDPAFILFDVRVGEFWLRREDVVEVASKFGVPIVPIVGHGTLREACEYVQSHRASLVAEDKTLESEGLVLRPIVRLLDAGSHRVISKIKAVDYRKLSARGE